MDAPKALPPHLFASGHDAQLILDAVGRVERKADLALALLRITLRQESDQLTTTAEIQGQVSAILAKATAESDALTAIAGVITDYKAQVSDLQARLDAAIASQADQATLQAISDDLKKTNDALDANKAAEAALTNTSGGPVVTPPAPAPSVRGLLPSTGSVAGGDTVSISGSNFTGASGVSFGANAAASFAVNNDTSINATTPAGSAGDVNVTVTGPTGVSADTATFTYE